MRSIDTFQTVANYWFGVSLPTTSVVLKKAYRSRCLEIHPDVGGDEREFKDMCKAYDYLTCSEALSYVFEETEIEIRSELSTISGVPLKDLGLGLGPTTNGKDCPRCDHKGYTENRGYGAKACPSCCVCKRCKGSGYSLKTKSGKYNIICLECNGSGTVEPSIFRYCEVCSATRRVEDKSEFSTSYRVCALCRGSGELPVFNPVLPKGALWTT